MCLTQKYLHMEGKIALNKMTLVVNSNLTASSGSSEGGILSRSVEGAMGWIHTVSQYPYAVSNAPYGLGFSFFFTFFFHEIAFSSPAPLSLVPRYS